MVQKSSLEARPKLAPWAHVLAVHDIDLSARYFCDVLGFALEWPDAPDWRLVRRDAVRIMLGKCPNAIAAAEIGPHNWFAYLNTDDADKLYADLVDKHALILQAPADKPYGMREFVVATPDGH